MATTSSSSAKKITAAERKQMEKYRKRLLQQSAELRQRRAADTTPELLKAAEALEKEFRAMPVASRKKFNKTATAVTESMEQLYPLREKPLWVKATTWWRYRKIRKQMLHHAKVSRCMREDLLEPEVLEQCRSAEKAFKQAKIIDFLDFSRKGTHLTDVVQKINPPEKRSKWGENLEIAVVAIAVALGARTYFIQPFKIPTGSMQPTLYGQTFEEGETKHPIVDKPWIPVGLTESRMAQYANPLHILKGFLSGRWYREYRAPNNGVLRIVGGPTKMGDVFCEIQGPGGKSSKPFRIHSKVVRDLRLRGQFFEKGDIIAAVTKVSGDHILVNKLAYNYGNPHRGDIIVFSTRNVQHPNVSPLDFYIKRLVGMPGEKISIGRDYRLYADGEPVFEPDVFKRQYLRRYDHTRSPRLYGKTLESDAGFRGYAFSGQLSGTDSVLDVGEDRYLPMGDNTHNSLDGRTFGGIPETDLIGKGWCIYWPFFRMGKMDQDLKRWTDRLPEALPGGANPLKRPKGGKAPVEDEVPAALAP